MIEDRIKNGCRNKAGLEPILGANNMIAEFTLDKLNSSIGEEKAFKVRHFRFMVGNHPFADFERNDASKNKVNQKTVVCIANHLNHFLSYLQINDRVSDLHHFLAIMRDIDIALSKKNINQYCLLELDELDVLGRKVTYADKEREYFLKIINQYIVDDTVLLNAVSDYTYDTTLYATSPIEEMLPEDDDDDEEDKNKKLEKIDLHVLHCVALYTKLIFILYYRVGGSGQWISVVKNELIYIANKANDIAIDKWFLEDRILISSKSFMDRLHDFLLFSMKKPLYDNKNNIEKFRCVGIDPTKLLHNVIEDVLSLLYRLNIVDYLDQKKLEDKIHDDDSNQYYEYTDIKDYPSVGLVAANTAAYIHAAKKRIVKNRVGNFDPDYIIKSFDDMDDTDGSSDGTKFEMHLQKDNKENEYKYNDVIITSMEDIRKNIINEKLLVSLSQNHKFKRTLFSQFMVSVFLEQYYGCDFSPSLSMSDFIAVIVRVHECLVYPKLRIALLGETQSRKNSNQITLDEIHTVYQISNVDKIIKTLSEMTKSVYIFSDIDENNNIRYSPSIDIKDELLEFINNNCNFYVRP